MANCEDTFGEDCKGLEDLAAANDKLAKLSMGLFELSPENNSAFEADAVASALAWIKTLQTDLAGLKETVARQDADLVQHRAGLEYIQSRMEQYKRRLAQDQDFSGAAAVRDCQQLLSSKSPKESVGLNSADAAAYRRALLLIGAQHPAWSSNPPDNRLVRLFNELTANARAAVAAAGNNDDEKADWCSAEAEKSVPTVRGYEFTLVDIEHQDDVAEQVSGRFCVEGACCPLSGNLYLHGFGPSLVAAVEKCNGCTRLLVWANSEHDEPTHTICLCGALESEHDEGRG